MQDRKMKKLPLLRLGKNINSEQQLQEKERLVQLLKQYFGYHEFRGKQLEAIEAVLSALMIYEDLGSGNPTLRLLYVTPELIVTHGFMSKLMKLYARGLLNLITIDEVSNHYAIVKILSQALSPNLVHLVIFLQCRPSYQKLSCLRKHLPNVPMLALTATAVPKCVILCFPIPFAEFEIV
ncbi:hypothetical protein ACLOJK_025157 [Asimina triloba]